MSALSEALERQLRKIMPLPQAAPAKKPAKAPIAVNEVASIHLAYQEGSSDKVYHVQVVMVGKGFEVNFQYGRRGKTLIKGTKTPYPVSHAEALSVYRKLVDEKRAKGYKEI